MAVAAIVVAALVGCGSSSATKAGKTGRPAILRMAVRDVDLAGDPAAADFVTRVGILSGGALRIALAPYWGSGAADAEQRIVRDVAGGGADLGAVGTRVFDTVGVRSLQAL